MTKLTDVFEEDLRDKIIRFLDTKEEVASITYMKIEDETEIRKIFDNYTLQLNVAMPIIRAKGYSNTTTYPHALTWVTETREKLEEICGVAVSPWELRSTFRFKFTRGPALKEDPYVVLVWMIELRHPGADDGNAEILFRDRQTFKI